jgi:translation initiation factor IF-2
MVKIRVFELARDLNMTTKELMGNLEGMGVEVKSHMSSLEDDTVSRIKGELFDKKAPDVEETRIRPTVIRRRRKAAPEPSATDTEASSPEEDAAVEVVSEEKSAPEPVADEETVSSPMEDEATPETVVVKEEASPSAEETDQETVAEVSQPVEVEPVPDDGQVVETAEPLEAAESPEAVETLEAAESLEAEEVQQKPDRAAVETDESPVEPEPVKAEKETSAVPSEVPPEEVEKAPAESPKPKKTKEKKKSKKDAPAKIIQLPEKPVAPPKAKKKPSVAKVITGAKIPAIEEKPGIAEPPAPDSIKEKRGKRGKKEEVDQERKFLKKKTAFRRKEVIEGAALYTGQRAGKGRKKGKAKQAVGQKPQITVAKAIKRRIKIDDTIVLSDLAKRMGIKAGDMIRTLMGMGVMVTVNQTIDYDTAVLVAAEFNYEVERAGFEEDTIITVEQDDPEKMVSRPPVVTIMGHVDHGKTSLLDVIRKTRITDFEAGGITQHIGAYHVTTDRGQIVFLDTPGHEAFTAMRARGAKVTDLVVLVVAADDGVMPQTVEAINHSKASEVPIVVAINKIDKANAEPDRVQRQLSELGLSPEEWGGDTIFVPVSAKQNTGIDNLLELILLQAEMLELKANPSRLAAGYVVEAKLDAGRGPVATVLVQKGTLNAGDSVVCGVHYGKVRAMLNDLGEQVTSAGPSIPVEVIGLSGVPVAGDELIVLKDEKNAKQISEHRLQKQRAAELAKSSRMSLEKLFEKMKEGEVKDLNIIIKGDVDGSIEALKDSLVKLSNEEVKINVIHSATGTITESDVSLAAVSDAIIIGFNVRPNTKVADLAHEENVDMRFHNVIYNVIKEMKDAIVGMMASTFEERLLGKAEVREVFHVPKVGAIAGSYVTDGKIERSKQIRLVRDGVIQYEGVVSSLRRFKDDVKEVQNGYECGIGVSNYNDVKVGDVLECFYMEEIRPEFAESK